MRLALPLLALSAGFAPAAASASSYTASLAAAPKGNFVARDVLWSCAGSTCQGATPYSRPLIVCQSVAKAAGRVEAFKVDGQALSTGELGRCNASVKPAAANDTLGR